MSNIAAGQIYIKKLIRNYRIEKQRLQDEKKNADENPSCELRDLHDAYEAYRFSKELLAYEFKKRHEGSFS